MAPREKPPRAWKLADLEALGARGGEKSEYLKAVPVLILENWVLHGRKEGSVANFIYSRDLKDRLEEYGLVSSPFKEKGTSNLLGALGAIQRDRNLIDPILTEYQKNGSSKINLPFYEPLLQQYRKKFKADYPEKYKKLFPNGEPEWESPLESEKQIKIHNLLSQLEQAFRNQQDAVEKLKVENQNLQADLIALQTALQEKGEVPHIIVDEELREDCAKLLENKETYIDALRRAGVVLEERLRKTVGGNGQEKFMEGVVLVDYALTPKTGKLIISDHPAEQDGVRMLFRGAVLFVRNPPSHKKVRYSEIEARQNISLIDYLLMLLRQAKPLGA